MEIYVPTYVIGDVHGCFDELNTLLSEINFDEKKDSLWFTGDLVNVGPKSLETIRFIKNLQCEVICVLGNHDLALIGIAYSGIKSPKQAESCQDILNAPDCNELISWLRHRPLLHYSKEWDTVLVHAGLPPQWSLEQALQCANEAESILQSKMIYEFLPVMFGDEPSIWNDSLQGLDRIRYIINALTRIRYVNNDYSLNLTTKGTLKQASSEIFPWFTFMDHSIPEISYIFGHWSALMGKSNHANIYAMDAGCVWGNGLKAIRLPDFKEYKISSKQYARY